MMGKEIVCPKCKKSVHRTVSIGSAGMSGLCCSLCRLHFDIKIEKNGSYKVVAIRQN